jgi:hypothetical protein
MEKERKYLLLNWILLSGYACLNLLAFYISAYSWPTQGSVVWLLLIIFSGPFLYHSLFIVYVLTLHQRPHWKKIYRLMTMVAGILLAGGVLLLVAQKISLARFTSAYGDLVAEVSQKMPQPCGVDYSQIPAVTAYNQSTYQMVRHQGKPIGLIFYNQQRFGIYFRAGSVDMDSATLFYDSETKNWLFFHNEDLATKQQVTERMQGLAKCAVF